MGDPFQGLIVGSCLTLRNESSEEKSANQARNCIGRGCLAESSRVGERRRTALLWGSVSGFMVMELWARLSLAHHSDSGASFLVAQHHSARMDSSQKDSGRLVDMWTGLSSLLFTFSGLVVAC